MTLVIKDKSMLIFAVVVFFKNVCSKLVNYSLKLYGALVNVVCKLFVSFDFRKRRQNRSVVLFCLLFG